MKKCKRSGFTLVEVLIVVVIMAVLAATIIPQFSDSSKDAKVSSVKFNLHTLRSQIELYKSQHDGKVPSLTLTELSSKTNTSGTTNTGDGPLLYGPYIQKIPVNPFTNSNTAKKVTAAPTSTDVTTTDGWLYNDTTGEIWINHADYLAE